MFKKGQLVVVDVNRFYHFYKPKLPDSNFDRDLWLKDWINNLDKITNGTRILRTGTQDGDAVFVKTLNGESSWYLNIKVLIPYMEKTFCCLKYHL